MATRGTMIRGTCQHEQWGEGIGDLRRVLVGDGGGRWRFVIYIKRDKRGGSRRQFATVDETHTLLCSAVHFAKIGEGREVGKSAKNKCGWCAEKWRSAQTPLLSTSNSCYNEQRVSGCVLFVKYGFQSTD